MSSPIDAKLFKCGVDVLDFLVAHSIKKRSYTDALLKETRDTSLKWFVDVFERDDMDDNVHTGNFGPPPTKYECLTMSGKIGVASCSMFRGFVMLQFLRMIIDNKLDRLKWSTNGSPLADVVCAKLRDYGESDYPNVFAAGSVKCIDIYDLDRIRAEFVAKFGPS